MLFAEGQHWSHSPHSLGAVNNLQHLCGEQHKPRLTCHPFSFCWDPSKQKPSKTKLRCSVCSVLAGWFNKSRCFLIKQYQRYAPELSAVTFPPSLCPKTAAITKKGFRKQQGNPWFFWRANEYFLGLNQSLEIIVKFTVVFLPQSVLYSWQTWLLKRRVTQWSAESCFMPYCCTGGNFWMSFIRPRIQTAIPVLFLTYALPNFDELSSSSSSLLIQTVELFHLSVKLSCNLLRNLHRKARNMLVQYS